MVAYDIVGNKFGRYTVLKRVPNKNTRQSRWLCQCDCGTIKEVFGFHLVKNIVMSCGCLNKEKVKINEKQWKGHGEISGSYWSVLKYTSIKRNYEFSITIDEAWDQFIKQNRKCALTGDELCFVRNYKKNKGQSASLDRINSDLGYLKDNIQWVHKGINKLKSNFNEEKLIEMCLKIYNFKLHLDL